MANLRQKKQKFRQTYALGQIYFTCGSLICSKPANHPCLNERK